MPFHLLLPLFSSIVFVFGMIAVRKATRQGAKPWTGTMLGNLFLAALWLIPAAIHRRLVPVDVWWQCGAIGALFVLGQLFTFMAFQHGDVSLATPLFGIKVPMVAMIASLMVSGSVPGRVWLASFIAAAGVALVQSTQQVTKSADPGSDGISRLLNQRNLTVTMVVLSAVSLSFFDVLIQKWATRWESIEFMPVTFAATGLLSLLFVPWCDRFGQLRQIGSLRPMVLGALCIAVQALSMSFAMGTFGDATRVNIVYSLRGLWSVVIVRALGRWFLVSEASLPPAVWLKRLAGALLLLISVVIALV